MKSPAFIATIVAAGVVCAAAARAQTPAPDGASTARIHLGALALDPRLNIRDVGVDTNVFNNEINEQRDTTFAIGPALDSWLRAGRLGASGTSSLDWNYFRKSSSQRSFDASQTARADVDLGRLVPHVGGAIEQTRQRLNVDLDARVRRHTRRVDGGVRANIGAKLTLDIAQERRHLDFDDQQFRDVSLDDALSRRETETTLTGRYLLTPLTTLVAETAARRDRFLRSPLRNADTAAFTGGLVFKPLALISGTATMGVRRFTPRSTDLPPFQGLIADVDLAYVMRDLTRWTLAVMRDVDYSYETSDPYFVSTGVTASVTQALGGGFDIVARGSRTTLDYQALTTAAGTVADGRRDHINVIGGGVGRRLGTNVRVGIDVNRAMRRSTQAGRGYQGVRVGGSLTYGF
ncbi:MAG: outer membrane beta-barrel protein [Acidobacteriota bacterium]